MMKSILNISLPFLLLALLMTSCTKEESVVENPCEFEIVLEPFFCSFNPSVSQDQQFPAAVISNGVLLTTPDYTFEWSKDAEYFGSAISVSYLELPLTVTVTEVASGCTIAATLDETYW